MRNGNTAHDGISSGTTDSRAGKDGSMASNGRTSSVDATVPHRGAADRLMAEALTVIETARRHGARIRA